LNLIYDTPQAHKPNYLCIFLVDIDENTYGVRETNIEEKFGEDFTKLMQQKLSPIHFFREIENYKQFLEMEKYPD
jgi:hypothetical protein